MKLKLKWNIWTTISLVVLALYLVFLVYPLGNILKIAIFPNDRFSFSNFVTFFSKSYYSQTLWNSFKVSVTATAITLVLGLLLGYLFSMYRFKGKKLLQILIVIASMSAPFVGAYSWILLLGRNGVITNFLTDTLHFPQFNIYGFAGIVLVFSLQLFPLVFLYIVGAFSSIDNSLLEASENMGNVGFKRFLTVICPLLLPTILASALLVFMRAFSDFGTPMLIGEGYRTFPVLIYTQFISEVGGNASFASSLAIIAIVISLFVFIVQKYVANKNSFSMSSLHSVEPKTSSGIQRVLIYLVMYGVVGIAIMPQIYLIYTSFKNTSGMIFVPGYSLNSYTEAFSRMGSAIWNSIYIPLIALAIVIVLASLISYMAVKQKNKITSGIDILSMIPYIVPGTVMGISLLAAFSMGIAGSGVLAIVGTAVIIIVSLVIRRLPYTIRSSVASLGQIPSSIEEAAENLGSSRFNTFIKIMLPMMASGIVSGAILSWITMLSELSTSILLYTVNTRTMPVAVYTEVLRGNYGIAAALSTIMTALTVAALLLFMKITKSDRITL
ncbi:iron ABC transporter permease [Lactovum odontotermitis]